MNIAILEKNKLYRESLKTILNQINDFKVIYEGDDLQNVIKLHQLKNVDIMIVDYKIIKSKSEFNLHREKELFPDTRLVVLAESDEMLNLSYLNSSPSKQIIFRNIEKQELERKIRNCFKSIGKDETRIGE